LNTNIVAFLAVLVLTMLAGCGQREAPARPGQALASVNGTEITVLQLNEELQRANVGAAQQQDGAASQLLEALIDRQLLLHAAAGIGLDREPKVMQAIERARALIIAQAYMQQKIGAIAKPSAAEVSAYYDQHPDLFARRRQFDMQQIIIGTHDLSPALTQAADQARTLDDVAAWLDAPKLAYVRAEASRTSADLAPALAERIGRMAPGRLFVVKEGPRSMFVSLTGVSDKPASPALAAPQIEQQLMTSRGKQAAAAELARLRAAARIAYLGTARPAAPSAPSAPSAPAAPTDGPTARGVAGLR
jgi:peptidyl-prolyl cis-trans isomerase C